MATTADFRNGMCLDIDGQYYFIVEFLHVKPGKGPAFVRSKLKNVATGRVLDKTWNSGVKVEEVRIERRPYQYLYKDEMGLNFMHPETFEQISIPEAVICASPTPSPASRVTPLPTPSSLLPSRRVQRYAYPSSSTKANSSPSTRVMART